MKTEFISDCAKCEMLASDCKDTLIENALDLINRQKAVIEKLKMEIEEANEADKEAEVQSLKESKENAKLFCEAINHAKSEAIKEFGHFVIDRSKNGVICTSDIPDLVKEMTEVETNQRKEDEGK